MNRFYTVLFLLISCLHWSNNALASHAQGADLTYQFVSYDPVTGQMRYVVTATFYRDCSGIAAPVPMPLTITNTACGGTYTASVSLPLINGLPCPYGGVSGANGCEVSQLCPLDLAQSTCNGGSGAYPGVQKYVYRDTITLPGTAVANNFCSQWFLSIDISARNPSTNLATSGDLYIEAQINNSINPNTGTPYTNSSASFGYDPVPFVCVNNAVDYNNGASDVNGDSLVFQLITPLQAHNSPLTFAAGYTVNVPVKVVGSLFNFNSSSGQIDFTPLQSEVDVLALKVSEYRNGVLVGSTIRDVQVKILQCTVPVATQYPISNLNNANLLDSITVQLCPGTPASWDIKMTDANGDSIVVKSNLFSNPSPLPGASIHAIDSSRSVVTAHINWTPQITDTGCHYYQVTTNTIDCPVEGNYTKSYRVCVFNKVTVSPHEAIYCGTPIHLSATGGTNSHWNPTTGLTFPNGVFDPLAAPSATTHYTFTSDCGTDTSLIIFNPTFTMSAGPGGTICQNNSIQLNASVDNMYAPYQILWTPSTGLTDPLTHNATDTILNPIASPAQTTTYTVQFTANTGCIRTDTVKVTVNGYAPSIQAKANPTHICPGQPTELTVTANPPCGIATTPCPDTTNYRVGTSNILQGGSGFTYPSQYGNYYKSARHQYLYHANELASLVGSGGTIKSISFLLGTLNSGSTLTNFTIRIGCVDPSIDSLTHYVSESDLTTVYTFNYTPINGWNTHVFNTPYNWDGHSNLVVDICFQNTTSNNINNKMRYSVTPYRSVWFTYTNAAAGSCGFTGSQPVAPTYPQFFQRPDTKFNVCVTNLKNANLLWTPSTGPNAPNPINKDTTIAHPTSQTTYHVTLMDTNGCNSTDYVTVYIDTTVTYRLTPDTFICSASPVPLHANVTLSAGSPIHANNITYHWSTNRNVAPAPPSGTGPSFATFNIIPDSTTTYICTITDTLEGMCTITDSITVILGNNLPVAKIVDSISCSGANDGKVFINMASGTPPYTYTWNPASANVDSITHLGPSTYYLTVTDNLGCQGKDTTKLVSPSPLVLVLDSTNIPCYAGATGTVTATVSGGRGPYRYTWSPAHNNTNALTGLVAGLYKLTVTDTSGCTISGQVNVTQPTQLTSFATSTNLSGAGTHDGTVTTHTTGGTPGYSYLWTPPVTGNVDSAIGLDSGYYYINVCDSKGCCVRDTAHVTVPPPINVQFTLVHNKCFGYCLGSASAVATGGVLPYSYQWSTNPVSTTDTITGLCAGAYTLTVTDSNGISVSNTIQITAPTAISMKIDSTPITCFGANNGALKDSAWGGTPGYTIAWSTGPNPLSGLSPGSYTVTVTDANNCTATDTAYLGQPTQVTATITSTDSVKCFGQSNGIARVQGAGGRPPYTYLWSGSASVADSATDLAAGPHTVTVTDAAGCTATTSCTINQPLQILVNVTTTPAHCDSSKDGTANAAVTNGTPSYTYTWDGTVGASSITGLSVGAHNILVTDINGCPTTQPFNIDTQYVLHISLLADSASCFGASDGQATVTVLNGSPGYTYLWTPSGSTSNPATGLLAGMQNVTVTDNFHCAAIDSVPVYQPSQIYVLPTFTNPLCYGDHNGKIWLSASGGQGPYTYSYNGVQHQMTDTITGLAASDTSYLFVVTDSKGCTQNAGVNLNNPPKLQISSSVIPITCANANNGLIRVTATGGTPGYTYTWNTGGPHDSVRMNLAPGIYIITVTDVNGCVNTVADTLIAPPPITVSALIVDSTNCPGSSDGAIHITVAGGTPGSTVPYRYSIDDLNWQDSPDFTNLTAGSYTVYVIDSQLCQFDTSVTVYQPSAITAAINPQDTSLIVGTSIQLNTVIGNLTTQTVNGYSWAPPTGLSCADCPNPVATPYQTLDYVLTINYGKNCITTASGSITVDHGPNPYIPNAFSPNGDGVNDEFTAFGTRIKSVSMRVFNRWGEKVFDSGDSQWASWDGAYKGIAQPTGVYVFVAEIIYLDGVKKVREGSLTLIR